MSYDTYRAIFIGGLVLSGLFLLTTIAIFFILNIKNVIGDLSGANARKGIENIKNSNAADKPKSKKKAAEANQNHSITGGMVETSKISPQDRFDSLDAAETSMLNDNSSSTETSVLSADTAPQETSILSADTQQPAEVAAPVSKQPANPNMVIELDITYVNSSEVIA